MTPQEQRLVKRLRYILSPLPEGITDEKILEGTKDTFFRARTELFLAAEDLAREICSEFNRILGILKIPGFGKNK